MKRRNAGDIAAKKQRKQAAAKARRIRRKDKLQAALMRKIRSLVMKIGQLEMQIKSMQAAALPAVPEAKE